MTIGLAVKLVMQMPLAFTFCFSATPGWPFPRTLIESLLLLVGVVTVISAWDS